MSLSVRDHTQYSVPLGVLRTLATKPRLEREGKGEERKAIPSVSLSFSLPADFFYPFFATWVKVATRLRSF